MAAEPVIGASGTVVDEHSIQDFKARLHGDLIRPTDGAYDSARKIWNGLIDKRPSLIARCDGAADVVAAVNFARENKLIVAVRGGGHSVAGKSVCDGGLMIDLSSLKGIQVAPVNQIAIAQPGLTWAEFDSETQKFGLATTGGVNSDTGVGGLTLGGGVGWLGHKHGLSCDNLLSAEIVTADGQLRTASPDEHPDLFWGLRGAGANFGVVTSFEFRLHEVGDVIGGMMMYPFEKAREGLRFYREYSLGIPDHMGTAAALLTAPDGSRVFAIITCYYGEANAADRVLAPLRNFASPVADQVESLPYTRMQSLLDEAWPPGVRSYWKSHLLTEIQDDAIETVVSRFASVPSPRSAVLFQQLGGAIKSIRKDQTAFYHRDAEWDFVIFSVWSNPAEDDTNVRWTRAFGEAMQPFSPGLVYVNNLGDDVPDRVRAAYGANYDRLVALKNNYDPSNLFTLNQNIRPTI